MIDLSALDKKELKELMAECYLSRALYAQVMFPETFFLPFAPKIHSEMFRVLEDPTIPYVNIIAPRGSGKTTIFGKVEPSFQVLFQQSKFIITGSSSATHAIQQAENLKYELENNIRIKSLFGNFESGKWSEKRWITNSNIMILPRGAGQQFRGLKYGDIRPQLLLMDDLEDDELVKNEDRMAEMHEWFFASVVPSVDQHRKKRVIWDNREMMVPSFKLVVVGTLLHHNSLLAKLEKSSKFTTIRCELCNEYFISNWPDYKTDEDIMEAVEMHREQDLMDVFYREYRGLPMSDKDRKFSEKMTIRYNCTEPIMSEGATKAVEDVRSLAYKLPDWEIGLNPWCVTAVIVDPAKEDGIQHNDTGIIVVTYDRRYNRVYIRDLAFGKFTPEKTVEIAFDYVSRFNAAVLGIEVTGSGKYLGYPFREHRERYSVPVWIEELKAAGRSKVERALGMMSLYRELRVWFNAAKCEPLICDLYQYPKPTSWDKIDCFSYISDLLDSCEIFALPEGSEGDAEDPEEEFRKLESSQEEMEPIDYSQREY